MKVYIVNLLCPDDEDTTQVVGVATSKTKAEDLIKELLDQHRELHDEDDEDDDEAPEDLEYSIEEHDLID